MENNDIYLLTKDGKLYGPFIDRDDAIAYSTLKNLSGYSTYDLLEPEYE